MALTQFPTCSHCNARIHPRWATCLACGKALIVSASASTPVSEPTETLPLSPDEWIVEDASPSEPAYVQPLDKGYPCIVCGKAERWNDSGIWRCTACWPAERIKSHGAEERLQQTPCPSCGNAETTTGYPFFDSSVVFRCTGCDKPRYARTAQQVTQQPAAVAA